MYYLALFILLRTTCCATLSPQLAPGRNNVFKHILAWYTPVKGFCQIVSSAPIDINDPFNIYRFLFQPEDFPGSDLTPLWHEAGKDRRACLNLLYESVSDDHSTPEYATVCFYRALGASEHECLEACRELLFLGRDDAAEALLHYAYKERPIPFSNRQEFFNSLLTYKYTRVLRKLARDHSVPIPERIHIHDLAGLTTELQGRRIADVYMTLTEVFGRDTDLEIHLAASGLEESLMVQIATIMADPHAGRAFKILIFPCITTICLPHLRAILRSYRK